MLKGMERTATAGALSGNAPVGGILPVFAER